MAETKQLHLTIEGAVQGVGFRPFVYRIARQHDLRGYVNNTLQGVEIVVEGYQPDLDTFLDQLHDDKPPAAWYQHVNSRSTAPTGFTGFEIRYSQTNGRNKAVILPDLATCPDCLREIFAPNNRRYHYPFTNCTNCGPRYTIIEALPYDRTSTTMRDFIMCEACQQEYEDPENRRFHAQPNACPDCGPHLECWARNGRVLSVHEAALLEAVEQLQQGKIVAVKGLGGFHLMVDARNETSVSLLRERKHRPHKPFALLMPNLDMVNDYCVVSRLETDILASSQAPIVLMQRKANTDIAKNVAPDTTTLGVMLPYTPLHHLLFAEIEFPLVATSGNISDEPICIDEYEALNHLNEIADVFLVHNRPILRPVDDSVVQVVAEQSVILRRARGYAPLPIKYDKPLPVILAVGGHSKNTVALSIDQQIIGSQHIGDLSTQQSSDAFTESIDSLQTLYNLDPVAVACDQHPDYASTQYAQQLNLPIIRVQHHYAHALACMLDNEIRPPVLAIVWDGTGFGTDGTIWGGEFLQINEDTFECVGSLRPFVLPGGEIAVKEPRRSALGLLYTVFGNTIFLQNNLPLLHSFTPDELQILQTMLSKGINTRSTSSAGRLFDGVAALLGLCQQTSYEGQAAIQLESSIMYSSHSASYYPFSFSDKIVDWEPMLRAILRDLEQHESTEEIAGKFHRTLVEMMVTVAKQIGEPQIALTGGCFQNKYLTEYSICRLREEGFSVYSHKHIPPNDGGIAYGQILAAERELRHVSGNTWSNS